MGFAWAPALDDVGALIPYRTRSSDPDGPDQLGTFSADTTPTDSQAQTIIDNAVYSIVAQVGEIPGQPDVPANTAQLLASQAKTAAAYQAAADIELAYPQRPGDVQIWTQLDQRAFEALANLLTAMEQTGSGTVASMPVGIFPQPDDLRNSVLQSNPYLIITD